MPKTCSKKRRARKVSAKPKLKSLRGAAKRFAVTGSGKVKRKQSHRRHILTKKSSTRKRQLRGNALVAEGKETRNVKRMLIEE